MAYVLTLLAVVGALLWATPVHQPIADGVRTGVRLVANLTAAGAAPIQESARHLTTVIREKTMELLREELHRSVDELVK